MLKEPSRVASKNLDETETPRRVSFREALKSSFTLSNTIFFAMLMTFLSIMENNKNSYIIFDNMFGWVLFAIVMLVVVVGVWLFLYGLIVVIGRHYWPHRFKPEETVS
jgi:hypothetical protein